MCRIPIKVYAGEEEIDEDSGQHKYQHEIETECNYQTGGTVLELGTNVSSVEVSGKCFFSNDIFPDMYEIPCGKVEIFGEEREIHRGYKYRNPDGTVNYVVLEIV